MAISTSRRILVTGGAGFLGSHLCERLLADGHQVLCLDNFFTGSYDNISHLVDHRRFRVLPRDVTQPLDVEVDEIYNLACPASPPHYQRDPIRTMHTCVFGAINMLELASQRGARILQASTSEVYGDPEIHPQSEDYRGNVNPTGVRACYDEGKRCAETLFFDYHRCRGVAIKVARIFNTYGPRMRQDDGRIVSNVIVQALKDLPITVYGDGSQTRSLCFVSDLIEGLVRLMASSDAATQPVNLGAPEERSILDLATIIRDMTGSRSEIVFQPLPADDPRRRNPRIEVAIRELGWRPRVSLEDGLKETIAYFRGRLRHDFSRKTPVPALASLEAPGTAKLPEPLQQALLVATPRGATRSAS